MSDSQLNFLKSLGINVDIDDLCSICNKPLMAAGSPLPQPCLQCNNSKYCVACSYSITNNKRSEHYCSKHGPLTF